MIKLPNCTYKESCSEGPMGALIINGVVWPRNSKFDPLAKIWSSCRKRIREQYDVDVAGLFVYDDEYEVVSCSFYLSFTTENDPKLYTEKFKDCFPYQMMMFEDAIESFLGDPEDGYETYSEIMKLGDAVSKETLDRMFDRFLKKMNLKTEKDEKEKKARKKKKGK